MLKSTGVVRKVDELGRIVIPIELRRTMGIEEKDALEIYVDSEKIIFLQEEVKKVHVDKSLNSYIVDIVNQTRKHPDITLGSSPRGSLCLFRASQAWALYNNRDYVIPDDIKKMVIPVLSHRIILKQEAKLKRIYPDDVLRSILKNVIVPMVDYDEV